MEREGKKRETHSSVAEKRLRRGKAKCESFKGTTLQRHIKRINSGT